MSGLAVSSGPDGTRIEAETYVMSVPRDRTSVGICAPDGTVWTELSLLASAHLSDAADISYGFGGPVVHADDDDGEVWVELACQSSAWERKSVIVVARAREVRLRLEVAGPRGNGRLGTVTLAGGEAVRATGACGQFRSSARFDRVFSPNPSEPFAPIRPASVSTRFGVVGDAEPGRRNGIFSPPPLCLGFTGRESDAGPWLGAHLIAPLDRLSFVTLDHDVLDAGWFWRMEYQGHTLVGAGWTSPELVLRPAPDEVGVLRDHHRLAVEAAGGEAGATPSWWREPILCGWGIQCAQAATTGDGPAAALATAANYDRWLALAAEHDLVPGTIVIDDKWQRDYGTCTPDIEKWPDLRGWIAERHRAGQRVLLWFKAWDPAGIPASECVTTPDGAPVAVDPSNPAYLARLDQIVHDLLGPDGLDADGFKVDFSQRAPSGAALRCAGDTEGAGVWGIRALHVLLHRLYASAKAAKPEALVITHTVNPLFADCLDMVRLNDIGERDLAGAAVPVVDQMRMRALVAAATVPGVPLDTDQWPMPDREQWLAYVRVQADLGVPALYYLECIDNSGERIEPADLAEVAASWAGYRRRIGES